jgi:hypothetical protein
MKNKFISMILLLAAIPVLITSCKKSDDEPQTNSSTRSASFVIGANSYSVSKPYIGIFNDNGTIKNTMTLTATDGSKIEFYFVGNTPATYPLMSFSDAYYINAAGKQYNSTSGQLIVSEYKIEGSIYKASGTFQFNATAIVAPIDSIVITSGVFTNASNEL